MFLRSTTRLAAATAVGITVVSASFVGATSAVAAPAAKPVLFVTYDVKGSTTLANPDSKAVVDFAPSQLNAALAADGSLTADLPLAPVRSSFKAYGFLPSSGTVVFTQVQPIKGALSSQPGQPLITSTAVYVVSLRNVVIGGTKVDVGTNCQTVYPVRVTVATEPGFDITTGGTLSGSYKLSQFQDCGAAQKIINATLPGAGNTLSLKFSNGRLTSPANDPRTTLATLLGARSTSTS